MSHELVLDPDLELLVLEHCARATDLMVPAAARYDGGSQGAGLAPLLDQPPDLLVSCAVQASRSAAGWRPLPERFVSEDVYEVRASDRFATDLLAALRRRSLPWSPQDAAVLLALASQPFHVEVFSFAVAAARKVLREDPGASRVLTALMAARTVLHEQPLHRWGIQELRQQVTSLLAAHAPGGLLDLSAVEVEDHWGPRVRESARALAARSPEDEAAVRALLRLLAEATRARPAQRWHREVARLLADAPALSGLVQEMLRAFVEAELAPVPAREDIVAATWLTTRANAVLVRGAALVAAHVASEDAGEEPGWPAGLLGQVALRGAARHPEPGVVEGLGARPAGGAIDALAARRRAGDAEAARQLGLLAGEITRKDLRTRVTQALAD